MTFLQFSILLLILASAAVTASGRSVTPVTDKSMTWMDTFLQKILTSWSSTSPKGAETKADNRADKRNERDAPTTAEAKDVLTVTTSDLDEPLTTTFPTTSKLAATTAAPTTTTTTATTTMTTTKLPSTPLTTMFKALPTSTVTTTSPPPNEHEGEELFVVNRTVLDDVRMHCRYAIPLRDYRPNQKVKRRVQRATETLRNYVRNFVGKINQKPGKKKRHIGRKYIVTQVFEYFDHDMNGIITLNEIENFLELMSIIRKRKHRESRSRET